MISDPSIVLISPLCGSIKMDGSVNRVKRVQGLPSIVLVYSNNRSLRFRSRCLKNTMLIVKSLTTIVTIKLAQTNPIPVQIIRIFRYVKLQPKYL